MNFEIKNIESFYTENLIHLAEELLHEDLIQGISALENNLWTMKVGESFEELQNGKSFEVEVQLTGKKVKANTCECDIFQQNKNEKNHACKHTVAGLFALRKRLLQIELEKQKSAPSSPSRPKKLTTTAVLNSVKPDALKNFVRAYARADKKFAIALKARFAHAVQLDDPKAKYVQLLQSTFNSVKNTKDKINYQGVLQIKSVINDILEHVDDAIALEYYSEAGSILQALVLKIAPNIKRAENHEEKMIDLLEKAISGFFNLVKKDLPQDLRKEIWNFCLEQTDGREHKKYQTQHHFFKLLLELTLEIKYANIFIEKIDQQLEFIFDQVKKGEILLVKMKVLEKFKKEELSSFIEAYLNEPEVLLAAVRNALEQENFKDAKKLALKGMETQKSIIIKNQLEDLLLSVAVKTKKQKEIHKYSRKRFLITYSSKYFQIFKDWFKGNWELEVDAIVEEIKKQPYTPNKKETLAIIFAEENRNGELINYIKKIRSLELLEKYDLQLIDEFKKDVYELYEDFLESYLRNHLGRQTSVKIRDIFFHLNKIGAQKLVRKLTRQFRDQYSDRHTLMQELAIF